MSSSKKILRVVLFLVLFIPTYFAIYNIYVISSDKFTVENITKIEVIGADGQIWAEYNKNDDVKLYIKTLDNAKSIISPNRGLENENPLVLRFYKGDMQFDYEMYLSLNAGDCIIKTYDNEYLYMNETDAQRIIISELGDSLYKNNRIPIARLYEGDDSLEIYPSGGKWNLRKPDDKFYESTVPNILAASANKGKAYQNKLFDIRFSVQPDIIYVEVKDDKEVIFTKDKFSNFVEKFSCDSVKDLQYVLTAEWWEGDVNDYCGEATYVIDVKYYVPPKFEISHSEIEQGEVAVITAYNMSGDENLSIVSDADMGYGYDLKFVQFGANRGALIPTNYDFSGQITLTLTSDAETVIYYLKVNERAVESRNMGAQTSPVDNVTPHLSAAAQSDRQSKYNEIFAVTSGNNEKYWTDKFVRPREGNLALEYGWKLTVNSGSAHISNGISITTAKGDSVKAANAGKVIFAGVVPYDGNLVVIDHGMGIKTWYGHLDTIEVKVGDGLLKNQHIGTSGTTGMYTSLLANLYFAVSVNNIFVNPVPLIKNGIPEIDGVNIESINNTEE